MGFNVYVTREIPEGGLRILREAPDVEALDVNPEDRVLTHQELLDAVKGRDGVLCLLTDKIDAEVMDSAEQCKVFANYAVGYDNIDVESATKRGIIVTNTPGVLTDATADLAWALLFSVARRVVEADRFMRQGRFKGWTPMLFLGADITGRTLGIIGAGRVGSAVAKRASAFRMKLLYYDPKPNPELEKELGAERVELDKLLEESDFVSIHCSLTPQTRHLIGKGELELMKPTAILINSARGPVVDEKALVEALREKKIAGAGFDVYENEPELTPGLAELDNVVLLPHIGSATFWTRTRMAEMASTNLLTALRGERPPNIVNTEVLERRK